jgi:hypothetical protein
MTLNQLKNLLHIGLENPAIAPKAIALTAGPKYLEIAKRLQDQASLEHADPRAVKAVMVLSTRPARMETFFPRSLTATKSLTLYEHSFN